MQDRVARDLGPVLTHVPKIAHVVPLARALARAFQAPLQLVRRPKRSTCLVHLLYIVSDLVHFLYEISALVHFLIKVSDLVHLLYCPIVKRSAMLSMKPPPHATHTHCLIVERSAMLSTAFDRV